MNTFGMPEQAYDIPTNSSYAADTARAFGAASAARPAPDGIPPIPGSPASSIGTMNVKKRKSSVGAHFGKGAVAGAAGADITGTPRDSPDADDDGNAGSDKKRTKTSRACDGCRTRKIRCDILPETSPPLCVHCKHHNFTCTWVLPITETRFKRKREAAAAAAGTPAPADIGTSAANAGPVSAPLPQMPRFTNGSRPAPLPTNMYDGSQAVPSPRLGSSGGMPYPPLPQPLYTPSSATSLFDQQLSQSAPLPALPSAMPSAHLASSYRNLTGNALHSILPPLASLADIQHGSSYPPPSVTIAGGSNGVDVPMARANHNKYPSMDAYNLPHPQQTGSAISRKESSDVGKQALAFSPAADGSAATVNQTNGPAESRLIGPTSLSHLLHSTSTLPVEHLHDFDRRHAISYQLKSTGDGFLKVAGAAVDRDKQGLPVNSSISNIDAPQNLPPELVEQLVNQYFDGPASRFPVITRTDFLSATTLNPLLLYTICGVAALAHPPVDSPLRTIKQLIAHALKDDEMMNQSSLQTIQALLIYAFAFELERGTAASRTWFSLGLAVRMAQDIGLHRETPGTSLYDLEQRRRIWACCVIADRWVSASYGLPMIIDLADCDRLYPSIHEHYPGEDADKVDMSYKPYIVTHWMLSLSTILGRVIKLLYSATGILNVSDSDLEAVQSSLSDWHRALPDQLQFTGPGSSVDAGYLHLCSVPVSFLLRRPFFGRSYELHRHSSFLMTFETWQDLYVKSQDSIYWAHRNVPALQQYFPPLYSLIVCALIQYHTFIRVREAKALEALQMAMETLKSLASDELFVRSRLAELSTLLHNTAVTVDKWTTSDRVLHRGINPTPGSRLIYRGQKFTEQDRKPLRPPKTAPGDTGGSVSHDGDTPVSASARSDGAPQPEMAMPNNSLAAYTNGIRSITDIPSQACFEATGFMNTNGPANLDFLGPYEGPYDAINFPEGLLDFGAWANFFNSSNPAQQ